MKETYNINLIIKKNMDFIRDLKGMDKVSPEWVDTFEDFIPKWLESLVPHYELAKKGDADVLQLGNAMYFGEKPQEITENNVHYYLADTALLGKMLSFNGDIEHYPCSWREGFEKVYPGPKNDTYGSQRIADFMYYDSYVCRYWNRKKPYDELAKRIEKHFQELIDNDTVLFDFSTTSYILLNPSKKWYIDHYKYLEA